MSCCKHATIKSADGPGDAARRRAVLLRLPTRALVRHRLAYCRACRLQVRWGGLDWCGRPYPLRAWLGEGDGCGCCLNVKVLCRRCSCPRGKW